MPSDMSEPAILVCALADSPRVVPGSIFNHHCTVCGRRVMVAPSGQRMLATIGALLSIVCEYCFEGNVKPGDEFAPAGTIDEVLDEARRAQPNLRRSRN
jgi:hypothetical protein